MIYCDYIAHLINTALVNDKDELLEHVGHVRLDLDVHGAFSSTKKTIEVSDIHGTKYKITVEAI